MTSAAQRQYFPRRNSTENNGGGAALNDEVVHQGWSVLKDRIQPSGHLFSVPTKMEGGGAAVLQLFERMSASPGTGGQVSSASADVPPWKSELEALGPNWDDEGAPTPSPETVSRAVEVVSWAELNGLLVESVDADVLGGVAIYLKSTAPKQRAWVSVLNNGRRSILIDADGVVEGRPLDDQGLEWLKAQFVTGDAAAG